jgi:hypothetical protein
MDKDDEIRAAEQELAAALKRIKEAKAGKMNFGYEATYGQAYQRLVRLGVRPQLRGKYRG